MGRYSRLKFIRSLDPEHDCERVNNLVTRYEFPLDYRMGFELAILTDFTMPSISGLFLSTGQVRHHGQKRFDDAMLFEYEMKRAGLDSPHGRASVRALNKIHGHYDISNDDYLFVLASHTLNAIHWINAHGWRRLTGIEVAAMVNTNRRMGTLMGIKDIPADYAGFTDLLETQLRERARFDEANREAAWCIIRVVQSWYPRALRATIPHVVAATVDARTRTLLGLEQPPPWIARTFHGGLRARGALIRYLPPRPTTRPATPRPATYPGGWTLDQLGPRHRPGRGPR
ncbi:oxygenase MpaB family protein [Streptomyces pakalii]|uniref:Oxygenase MpaB family protein n=1 Tax=Streptomyces pakalii TaxID=3036494 RepID=A0ABT7DA89_9ACTN|nr:oxygenase MpaB family protein [Streptomyces pakalii]MDJ1642734.1 oxygenase MpaB family protein [Streptomyces pakalii]